jgi:sugar phosphate isomerase/epimerase
MRAQGGNKEGKLTVALNAYSFNRPLRAGDITLPELVDYCAEHGIDGLDATGYYFPPEYPRTPSDEYLFALKRQAFQRGITICGTGVRNDFTVPDASARKRDVQMAKDWIVVAQKLGASIIRLFSGRNVPPQGFEAGFEWLVADLKECAAFGEQYGVMVGLQHHHDFLKTAAETIRVIEAVDSPWLGVILDVGSLRQGDPYEEIEKLLPYATSWQVKENVWYGEKQVPIDLKKLKSVVDRVGYSGYFPIETLGEGDPRVKVAQFLKRVREVFG